MAEYKVLPGPLSGCESPKHAVCISAKQVYGRQSQTAKGSQILFEATDELLKENIEKGNLK